MTLTKCWILCAVSLACLARCGSCTRHREHKAQPEMLIFNELCALKAAAGPCKAIKPRFFFDVDAGQCEAFDYGGCQGNSNNFETLEECQEMCVVSADKSPCHLPEAPGPCRGLLKRFFFDTNSQQCEQFYYGGCFGNANNFKNINECKARCENPVHSTTAPEVHTESAQFVHTTVLTGELTVSEPSMPPNASNEERNDVSESDICLSPVERGTCRGSEKRYAYNQETKRCQKFSYSGCEGNGNNFLLRKHCIHKCIKSRRDPGIRMIRIRKKNMDSILRRPV